jgi:phytoene dehydrogenase-like protein
MKQHLQTHHMIYHPNPDIILPSRTSEREVHQKMWMELSSPSVENPALSPPGKSSLVLQTFSHAEWQDHWNNRGESRERTPEYRELKKAVGLELAKNAEAVIPGLTEKIEYMDVGTPLSSIRFTMNSGGASAGWTYSLPDLPIASKFGFTSFRTPIRKNDKRNFLNFPADHLPGDGNQCCFQCRRAQVDSQDIGFFFHVPSFLKIRLAEITSVIS